MSKDTKITIIISTARHEEESFFKHWKVIAKALREDIPCNFQPLSAIKEPFRALLLDCVKDDMESFLEPTLESLTRQTFQDFEVIIVDWHSEEEARKRASLLYKDELNIQHVKDRHCKWFGLTPPKGWEADVTPAFPNVSGARNLGAILAEGELLMFLDDNIILEQKTLETAWKYYQEGLGLKLVRNRYNVNTDYKTPKDQIDVYYEFQGDKQYRLLWVEGKCGYSYRGAWSHGFTVSLENFLAVNGFEEVLTAGTVGGEDIDLANRLYNLIERNKGCKMVLDTDATIWELGHHHFHRGRHCVRLNILLLDFIRDWDKDTQANTRKPNEAELSNYHAEMLRRGEKIHPLWGAFLVDPFDLRELRGKHKRGEPLWEIV